MSSRVPDPLRRLTACLKTMFGGVRQDRELDDELRAYLEHRIEREVARGATRADARRRVLAEEGGLEAVKEQTRAARVGFGAVMLLRDLRFGVRMMRRAPAFTLVAGATLALGIGATITMFTVMRSVLWRPLPYPDPDRLVVVEVDARGVTNAGAAGAEVRDLQARSRTLAQIAVITAVAAHVAIDDEVDGLAAGNVSDALLPALGVAPVHGRALDSRRDGGAPGATGVLISDALWRRRLGGDPNAVGRRITINNQPREIVGVLPPGFTVHLPPSIGASEQTDVWFSTSIDDSREFRGLGVIARLAPGVTLDEAQRDADALAAQLATEHPAMYRDGPVRFRVRTVHEAVTDRARGGLRALGWAVAFVLLVSCVNVANLLLARGAGRARELAIRRALGASRARIALQLLVESVLLSALACALGLQLARWGIEAVEWLRPTHLPRQAQIGMDASVALFAVALALGTAIVFGLLPALRLSSREVQPARAGRGETSGRHARRLHRGLVVAEIALSIVPLVAAGLMLRSFLNLNAAPLGLQPHGVLTAQMPISFRQFASFDARWQLHREAFDRVRALPGVDAISAVSPVPFGPLQLTRRFGRAGEGSPSALTTLQSVFPGAFHVLGTRLVQGRDFTDQDLAERRQVVVIDARIAQALWPDGAIGQRLALANGPRVNELEVVGVSEPVRVRDVRGDATPHVFVPYHVFPIEMALVVKMEDRTRAADDGVTGALLAAAIRRAIASLGTGRAVEIRPLDDFVAGSIAETRFIMLLLGGFAIAGVLLAGIGLYGTLAYLTAQRAREFGVRMALGATRIHVLRLVTGESALLTVAGIAIGGAAATAVSRTMRGLFYEIAPSDAITLATVLAVVGVVSLVASMRPAWLAGRIDPARALRAD